MSVLVIGEEILAPKSTACRGEQESCLHLQWGLDTLRASLLLVRWLSDLRPFYGGLSVVCLNLSDFLYSPLCSGGDDEV